MKHWLAALALLPLSASAAPTSEDIAAYRALAALDLRLATIGYRLASANAAFCKDQQHEAGWVIHDIAQYPDRETAQAAFGFARQVAVSAVVPGSRADQAGIEPGDAFVAVRGRKVDEIETRKKSSYSRVEEVKKLLADAWRTDPPADIQMQRGANLYTLRFTPPLTCASDFQVDVEDKVDAGANGEVVRVTSGLMNFAPDDNELAAAVAHELAHNLLHHRTKLAGRRKSGSIRKTEIEADRLSVWLLANAGYDLEAAMAFWERYGRKYDPLLSDGTHPGWKKRIASMREEMASMKASGKPAGSLEPPLLVSGAQ